MQQTDVRRAASSLNASALWGRGHNKLVKQKPKVVEIVHYVSELMRQLWQAVVSTSRD